jgi:hypothetical protein
MTLLTCAGICHINYMLSDTNYWSNTIPTKNGGKHRCSERISIPAALVGSSASYKMMHIVRSILTKFVYTKHLGKEGRVLKHVFCLSDQANSSWWPLVVGITEHVIYVYIIYQKLIQYIIYQKRNGYSYHIKHFLVR